MDTIRLNLIFNYFLYNNNQVARVSFNYSNMMRNVLTIISYYCKDLL